MPEPSTKYLVARTLKWNTIDRLTSQVLYTVTGIILANLLTQEDFGLVGAVTIFQAFAALFVDSGFSYALIQRKHPTDSDYSTVFWFNMGMAVGLYLLLYAGAHVLAWMFDGDMRLVPLSRVMFLSIIINAGCTVQINIRTKKMDMKMVAISNTIGMVAGAAVGIVLAVKDYGAWAVVWQTLTLGMVKGAVLWCTSRWRPLIVFSWNILKSYFKVGFGVMGSSWLNVLFQNINGMVIGNRNGMSSLGYYTQADKWSKMGVSSLAQILNTSFLPVLSEYQDEPRKFAGAVSKMNRVTAYLTLPSCIFLMVMATPLFHCLFGTKWDASIVLFQLLLLRGIFVVISSVYNNYLIALGRSKLMMASELLRDGLSLIAIIVTVPYIALSVDGDITRGLQIFVGAQVIAAFLAWVVMLVGVARLSHSTAWRFVLDLVWYAIESVAIGIGISLLASVISNSWLLVGAQGIAALTAYVGLNWLLKSKVQQDAFHYITKKL